MRFKKRHVIDSLAYGTDQPLDEWAQRLRVCTGIPAPHASVEMEPRSAQTRTLKKDMRRSQHDTLTAGTDIDIY